MLGILVILVVSGLLLYFINQKNILVLGLLPTPKRLVQFLVGFVFLSLINLAIVYLDTLVKNITWESHPVNYGLIIDALVYHTRSALTEDLIFRGAILYLLIAKLGAKKGVTISAICFGVYHVFSYGMSLEYIVPVIYVVIVTGFTGYVWAYSFNVTGSIFLGLGLHVGSNMLMSMFYPSSAYGELLFSEISSVSLEGWIGLFYSLFKGFLPAVLTLLCLKILIKHKPNLINTNSERTV